MAICSSVDAGHGDRAREMRVRTGNRNRGRALKTSFKILLADSSFAQLPVPGCPDTHCSWDSTSRLFLLSSSGEDTEMHFVHKLATAMRITFTDGKVLPALSPLVPPRDALHHAFWQYGFTGGFREKSLRHARVRLISLRKIGRPNREIVERQDFIFVFEHPERSHAELKPVLWAAEPGLRPQYVEPVLRLHCAA